MHKHTHTHTCFFFFISFNGVIEANASLSSYDLRFNRLQCEQLWSVGRTLTTTKCISSIQIKWWLKSLQKIFFVEIFCLNFTFIAMSILSDIYMYIHVLSWSLPSIKLVTDWFTMFFNCIKYRFFWKNFSEKNHCTYRKII